MSSRIATRIGLPLKTDPKCQHSVAARHSKKPALIGVGQGAAHGGRVVVGSVADACRESAVITMLANDNAVEGLVLGKGGVIDSLPRGGIHISSSTISVALSEALAKAHAKAGIVTGDRQRASSTSRSLRESRTALASGIIPNLNHDLLSFESRY